MLTDLIFYYSKEVLKYINLNEYIKKQPLQAKHETKGFTLIRIHFNYHTPQTYCRSDMKKHRFLYFELCGIFYNVRVKNSESDYYKLNFPS